MHETADTETAPSVDQRERMRSQARERLTREESSPRFRTPEWLDRSFVLPVSGHAHTPEDD